MGPIVPPLGAQVSEDTGTNSSDSIFYQAPSKLQCCLSEMCLRGREGRKASWVGVQILLQAMHRRYNNLLTLVRTSHKDEKGKWEKGLHLPVRMTTGTEGRRRDWRETWRQSIFQLQLSELRVTRERVSHPDGLTQSLCRVTSPRIIHATKHGLHSPCFQSHKQNTRTPWQEHTIQTN